MARKKKAAKKAATKKRAVRRKTTVKTVRKGRKTRRKNPQMVLRGKALAAMSAAKRSGASQAEARAIYDAVLGGKSSGKSSGKAKGRKKGSVVTKKTKSRRGKGKKTRDTGLPDRVPVLGGSRMVEGRVVTGKSRDAKLVRLVERLGEPLDRRTQRIARRVLAHPGKRTPMIVLPGPKKPRSSSPRQLAAGPRLGYPNPTGPKAD